MSSARMVRRKAAPNIQFADYPEQQEEVVFETGGIVLGDGECIELIKTNNGDLSLFRSGKNNAARRIKSGGRTYVPPSLHQSILEALALPTGRASCGSAVDIFSTIHDLFVGRGISDESAKLLAYYAISTWFPESLPIAPNLVITGPRPEAHTVLQLLSCVVRHALPIGELNLAGFRSLPMHAQLTLLITGLHSSMHNMLSTSAYRDAFLPCRDELFDTYCPKVVYAGARVADGFSGDAILKINLAPSHGKLPVIDFGTRQAIAADLQPRLLDYRLKYVANVHASDFDVPQFPSGFRILARALGICIVDAPDLQAAIAPLLEIQQEHLRASRWIDPHCVVLEALLNYCHGSPASSRMGIGEIAEQAGAILADRGERKVEAKLIGNLLRMFGFSPKRDSQGYALFLTDAVRRQIHWLAHDNEVEAGSQAGTNCVECAEIIGVKGGSGITSR